MKYLKDNNAINDLDIQDLGDHPYKDCFAY